VQRREDKDYQETQKNLMEIAWFDFSLSYDPEEVNNSGANKWRNGRYPEFAHFPEMSVFFSL
jgi:hypothetical protein